MDKATLKAEQHRPLGEKICAAMEVEITKLGFAAAITPPRWEDARFIVQRDPALGEESLEGIWLNEHGGKLGSVTIHSDSSFFAEYDIIRAHPTKAKWFIEAVSAWGRDTTIKSEARLLPVPD